MKQMNFNLKLCLTRMKLSKVQKMMEIIFPLNKKDLELLIHISKIQEVPPKLDKLPLITMQIKNNKINKTVNLPMITLTRRREILVKQRLKGFRFKMQLKDQYKSNNKP